jgi:hypothetical protein
MNPCTAAEDFNAETQKRGDAETLIFSREKAQRAQGFQPRMNTGEHGFSSPSGLASL